MLEPLFKLDDKANFQKQIATVIEAFSKGLIKAHELTVIVNAIELKMKACNEEKDGGGKSITVTFDKETHDSLQKLLP